MNEILLWFLLLPIVGTVACLIAPERVSKQIALILSIGGCLLAIVLFLAFDANASNELQFAVSYPWMEKYKLNFALGVDGLSLLLVCLSKLMMPIAILASWGEQRHPRLYMASFLLLDAAMAGTFLATDIFFFYVCWELGLIPMILIIGVWGSENRIFAALKFFLVTFAGSLLMLVGIVWLFLTHFEQMGEYSAAIASFGNISFPSLPVLWGLDAEALIFLAFFVAFAIKVPLFPFHTWLPDAHVQAPAGGSILLAAVLLKMGTYGLLRFCLPITPVAFQNFAPAIAVLALIGIIYGAWVAFQQADIKKLVAYSSVSHVGFLVLGICAFNEEALAGSILQMVNHGLSTGALFFLVGALYERRHSRALSDFGGLANILPAFSIFLVLMVCSSMGVPGLNGFVGEFLILLGTFKANPWWGAIGTLGVIFGAVYLLWMLRFVLWGELDKEENKSLTDLVPREIFALSLIAIFVVWLGIFPNTFLEKISLNVKSLTPSSNAIAIEETLREAPKSVRIGEKS